MAPSLTRQRPSELIEQQLKVTRVRFRSHTPQALDQLLALRHDSTIYSTI
jgi:hypothetical protein